MSTGLGDLYEAVRGRKALVEPPRGWAGGTAARWRGLFESAAGPGCSRRGCRDPLVGCGPGWSIWSRCIRVSDTGYFWWRPRGGGESTPVRRSRAWTRVGRVGSRRGAGWRHPVSGRQVYAALRPPVARRWVSPTSRVTRGGGFRLRGNESDTKVAVVQPGRQGPRLFGYRGQWLFMTGPEDGLPGRSLGEP